MTNVLDSCRSVLDSCRHALDSCRAVLDSCRPVLDSYKLVFYRVPLVTENFERPLKFVNLIFQASEGCGILEVLKSWSKIQVSSWVVDRRFSRKKFRSWGKIESCSSISQEI